MIGTLDTGIKNIRNVGRLIFGMGAIACLEELLSPYRVKANSRMVFLVDEFFETRREYLGDIPCRNQDKLVFVSTREEPTTEVIDKLLQELKAGSEEEITGIVGIGGGITLDTAKAISNLLTNRGHAADYQGWDLVKRPGVFKVGIPTISGTGAEATRTCVLTNKRSGLKLGMNSEHSVFDQLILDPGLTQTVPKEQYFFSGMDAWIHCAEALSGNYRNPIGDSFSRQAIGLCRDVFGGGEMMSEENRERLMVASYLGGSAIATTYVGVVHPFSAGLSVVLGLHHCIANCIVMCAMERFYPEEFREFMKFVEINSIEIPQGVCSDLSDEDFETLYQATITHEKPLINALGAEYRKVLSKSRVRSVFERM